MCTADQTSAKYNTGSEIYHVWRFQGLFRADVSLQPAYSTYNSFIVPCFLESLPPAVETIQCAYNDIDGRLTLWELHVLLFFFPSDKYLLRSWVHPFPSCCSPPHFDNAKENERLESAVSASPYSPASCPQEMSTARCQVAPSVWFQRAKHASRLYSACTLLRRVAHPFFLWCYAQKLKVCTMLLHIPSLLGSPKLHLACFLHFDLSHCSSQLVQRCCSRRHPNLVLLEGNTAIIHKYASSLSCYNNLSI